MRLRYGGMGINAIVKDCSTSAAMVRLVCQDWGTEKETVVLSQGLGIGAFHILWSPTILDH